MDQESVKFKSNWKDNIFGTLLPTSSDSLDKSLKVDNDVSRRFFEQDSGYCF